MIVGTGPSGKGRAEVGQRSGKDRARTMAAPAGKTDEARMPGGPSNPPATPPLRPGWGSDNVPDVDQRRPLWLFVQAVERRSRMERPVRSVLAAPYRARARSHPQPPDSPTMWPARWLT